MVTSGSTGYALCDITPDMMSHSSMLQTLCSSGELPRAEKLLETIKFSLEFWVLFFISRAVAAAFGI